MITMDDHDHGGQDLRLAIDDATPANLKVIGVGGGGGNAINRMIAANGAPSTSVAYTDPWSQALNPHCCNARGISFW